MIRTYLTSAALAALPALAGAQESRELDAHEHGVSTAEIAVEGDTLVIDLTSPGMDLVGFEYDAESAADKDAVAAAIRQLSRPDEIVALPEAAGCRLSEVLAHLHSGDHDHDETHAHAEEDMAEDGHDHAEDDGHAEGEEHDHSEGEGGAEHSAFHARYEFTCETPNEVTEIDFPFFALYENAQEIEAQYVTESGAGTAEIGRDDASLVFE